MNNSEGSSLFPRASGILLHITSLPGPHGIGDLGLDAYKFADFLAASQQNLWQVLPLHPTGFGNSPYGALPAFAGNPLLISLTKLVEDNLLGQDDLANVPSLPPAKVDYEAVAAFKYPRLRRAFDRFSAGAEPSRKADFESFCERNAAWLDDYALYMALKEAHKGGSWWTWEPDLVSRQRAALERARNSLESEVRFRRFLQFIFFSQWFALKNYANERNVRMVGDIPIFVAHDSADVWAHQEIFTLDNRGNPTVVAGVPPDFFSATGQRWGNPLYKWDVLARTGYKWWIERLREMFKQFDVVRLDHFRGFESYWEIPADQPTAQRGRWVKGPGEGFFRAVEGALGRRLPIIVEDLGLITPAVLELRDRLGYPGMKVLQFAFSGEEDNPYLPKNYAHNCVVYTATHDNDTTVGWFSKLNEQQRSIVLRHVGTDGRDIAWDLIRFAFNSVADTAIVPLQDVLSLGSEARMNFPGKAEGNWAWRFAPGQLTTSRLERLRELARTSNRVRSG